MNRHSLQIIVLIMLAGTIFFASLGQSKLWDRDEPRNAGCAAEMLERGDLVVPTFNSQLRQQKPVLLYWLMMAAYTVFGVNEFAARFWSAMFGIGTVLVTYGIAKRLFNPAVAFLAGIILATTVMFDVAARAATPDSVLIFFSTLAILFYVLGTFKAQERGEGGEEIDRTPVLRDPGHWFPKQIGWQLAMFAAMGMAVLAKGPVGLVLPMAIIGMFLLIKRLPKRNEDQFDSGDDATSTISLGARVKKVLLACLRPFHPIHFLKTLFTMRPMLAALVVLVVAGPWFVMVGIRTEGEFIRRFFLDENIGRATGAMENHGGGIWYYPVALLVGFFPWSVFWGAGLVWVFKRLRNPGFCWASPVVFMLCWVLVQVGLFSIAQTKLPSYVTPCYPALAILCSVLMYEWIQGRSEVSAIWYNLAILGMCAGGIMIVVGLSYVSSTWLQRLPMLGLVGAVPAVGSLIALWLHSERGRRETVVSLVGTAFCFSLLLFGGGTVIVDSQQTSLAVLDKIKEMPEDVPVAAIGALESSWVYYSGRPIHELNGDLPKTSPDSIESFIEKKDKTVILTTAKHYETIKKRLPWDYEILKATDYFLRENQIILLGRKHSRTKKAREASTQSMARPHVGGRR